MLIEIVVAAVLQTGDVPALAERIAACARIEAGVARLDCFDSLAAEAGEAAAPPASPAAPAAAPGETADPAEPGAASPVAAFGAEQTDAARRAARTPRMEAADSLKSIDAAVVRVSRTPRGLARFELNNGQVWEQARDDGKVFRWDEADDWTVRIRRKRLGGYILKVNEIGRSTVARRES